MIPARWGWWIARSGPHHLWQPKPTSQPMGEKRTMGHADWCGIPGIWLQVHVWGSCFCCFSEKSISSFHLWEGPQLTGFTQTVQITSCKPQQTAVTWEFPGGFWALRGMQRDVWARAWSHVRQSSRQILNPPLFSCATLCKLSTDFLMCIFEM